MAKNEDNDGLTAGERAYMQSGGTQTDLLDQERQAAGEQQQPNPEAAIAVAEAKIAATEEAGADADAGAAGENEAAAGGSRRKRPMVDKGALDEARAEVKQLRQEKIAEREKWARIEEKLKIFQEAMSADAQQEQPPEPEPELPDPEQDIIGFNRGLANLINRRFADINQRFADLQDGVGEVRQASTAQQQQQQMLSAYRQDAAQFSANTPDFMEAYRFLIKSRNDELVAAGYDDPRERGGYIIADEQALAERALKSGSSPAERLYALAKARGYQPAKPQNGNGQQNGQGDGAARVAARTAPSASEEIARLQRGQDASLSLSNVGGGKPPTMSLELLADMPMDQFRDFMRKNPGMAEALAGKGS